MNDIGSYAVDTYNQQGVRTACLELQDKGWDIPLLLFSGWYGQYHGVLSQTDLACVVHFTQQYKVAYVEPIRRMRQTMKREPLIDDLARWEVQREQVKQWELSSEHFQLAALCGLVNMSQLNPGDLSIRENLERLCHHYGSMDIHYWTHILRSKQYE
ncbi:TIGR02444 family protein [bacterium]|nr:TIGR02444 family protein [bacterium]